MPPVRPDRWNGLGSLRSLAASIDSHGISVTDFYLIGSTRLAGVEGGTFSPCRQSRSSGRVLCNPELKCSYLSFGEKSSMGSRNSCRPDLKILIPNLGTREGKGLRGSTNLPFLAIGSDCGHLWLHGAAKSTNRLDLSRPCAQSFVTLQGDRLR